MFETASDLNARTGGGRSLHSSQCDYKSLNNNEEDEDKRSATGD
jgi:hypothetical protein